MNLSKITSPMISSLEENEIFVFGSNLDGRHDGGAARIAMKWGAEYGNPTGLQGNTYAIPTLGHDFSDMDTDEIAPYVDEFIEFAVAHPELTFMVTPIGCGIAGHTEDEIGPLFKEALDLDNVTLPESFLDYLQ